MSSQPHGDHVNHPKYLEIIQLSKKDPIQANKAFHVYIDLCEVREWWNVKTHYHASLELVFLSGHPSRHEPRQIVLPLPSGDQVSPEDLQRYLADIKLEGYNTEGMILAVSDADSTLVYYKISDGPVTPEDPEMTEKKRQGRILRSRQRQSHLQKAANAYTDARVGKTSQDAGEGSSHRAGCVAVERTEDDVNAGILDDDDFADEL